MPRTKMISTMVSSWPPGRAGEVSADGVGGSTPRTREPSIRERQGARLLRPRRAWAARHPGDADALLRRARALREAIHAVFQDVAHARPPQPAALALLNREVQRLLARSRLEPRDDGDGFGWAWDGDPAAPERP